MRPRRGLQGDAAIVGYVELPPERLTKASPAPFTLEQWALLAAAALEDAGLSAEQVDGIVTSHLGESEIFVPSTVAEYLGVRANFAELLDLGGASAAGMVWRAAAAIELGLCDVVLCALPARYITPSSELKPKTLTDAVFFGSSSNQFGSPQAEFEIPYGNLGQNGPYGQVAQRYAYEYGYDERAMAKIVVDQRFNANHTEGAIWKDTPLSVEDVLASPVIADPLHMLEIVMPCVGGAAVVVASAEVAARTRNRPVWVKGFGEHVPFKTPTYAEDLLDTPIRKAADTAFAMTDLTRDDMDMVSIYDCYTITVLLSLEDAGFCEKGKGMSFVSDHDLTFRGDFPLNTAGGQLGFGQAGLAGGMHHVCDATRQIMGRAGAAQVADCNRAFVSGNGGILSEQTTLILEGE
ncbi:MULTISPECIES: thiolase family protein [Mycolicibacterium]|jgi:acetyl-CoA acetyltransferase|uniref:Nonspecific lipid-transfer protein n=3 Tax=Mycolicibacterium TaxID=1866885 RepID=A0A378W7X0_9MYCO|nr:MULTISPECIES: thiolase family protein [Mycolicibacterium]KLI08991.1 transporter [Mycolicibacterium senegalense]KLO52933.1 transporter [Mycolicibacterium senegalense]KMV15052.1 transporter [Mycolicibacterium conceptionense]MCV7337649.1 thiolase family protein [Mycolicibacterium senegalense]MCW1823602.1 thiolase family protein [Mycolicibacterium senegalense]